MSSSTPQPTNDSNSTNSTGDATGLAVKINALGLPFRDVAAGFEMLWFEVVWFEVVWFEVVWFEVLWFEVLCCCGLQVDFEDLGFQGCGLILSVSRTLRCTSFVGSMPNL